MPFAHSQLRSSVGPKESSLTLPKKEPKVHIQMHTISGTDLGLDEQLAGRR